MRKGLAGWENTAMDIGNLVRRAAAAGVLTLIAAGGALLLWAAPAMAHNALHSSSPAGGATVTASPPQLTMAFQESPNVDLASVTATDAAGVNLVEGPPTASATTLTQRLRPPTAVGAVTVTYRVVSTDGHPVQGGLAFTVTGTAVAAPPPAIPDANPIAVAASPTPSSAPSATPPAAVAASGPAAASNDPGRPLGPLVLVLGLLGGAITVAAALAFWPRRRSTTQPPTPSGTA
jgi:methionine-rich copper-binding protein CopC